MDFIDFARANGILIDALPHEMGVWKRYPTVDKPRKRNGSVKYMGSHGLVQNYDNMSGIGVWTSDEESPIPAQDRQRMVNEAAQRLLQDNEKAAHKALWILEQTSLQKHAYLASKGFANEVINVWTTDTGPLAVIPMWQDNTIVGCQFITENGEKRFLSGQRTGGSQFIFESQGGSHEGTHFVCEGYATGASVRNALDALKLPYVIHVCFCASNMVKVAATLPEGVTVADNDPKGAGEIAAREIGWKYWLSDTVREDFNDYHKRVGLFAASQSLLNTCEAANCVPNPSPEQQKQLADSAQAKALTHVGVVGGKETMALVVDRVYESDSAYGTQYRINLLDELGNRLTWKTTTPPATLLEPAAQGRTFHAEFKIKTHGEFKAEPQTAVSHLKFKGWVQQHDVVLSLASTSTAAFEDLGRSVEAARVVRGAADFIAQGWDGRPFDLKDTNGNKVGKAESADGRNLPQIPNGGIRLVVPASRDLAGALRTVADALGKLDYEGRDVVRAADGSVVAEVTIMPAPPPEDLNPQLTDSDCGL